MTKAKQRANLSGQKFGLLTVESFSHIDDLRRAIWNCSCACGGVTQLATSILRAKHTTSCGCALEERLSIGKLRHGLTKTKTWNTWVWMHSRCYQKSHQRYDNYGGRGIAVCQRWHTFENFYADMGEKPDGKSIERIDVNGNYSPENCKWVSTDAQYSNTTKTIYVKLYGIDYPLRDLVKLSGIKYMTAYCRIKQYGWTPERTFENLKPESLHPE